jgi:nucleoside diphosphate kinase
MRQVKYMTSDTVIVLTLEREGAIRAWRMLAGPTNSIKGEHTPLIARRSLQTDVPPFTNGL